MSDVWSLPLAYMPRAVCEEIAARIDSSSTDSFFLLAEHLGLSPVSTSAIYNRSKGDTSVDSSPTKFLFRHLQCWNITVGNVQRALLQLQGHFAANVMLEDHYYRLLVRSFRTHGPRVPEMVRSGVTGTEPSQCNCPACVRQHARSDGSGESAHQSTNVTGRCQDPCCSCGEPLEPATQARDTRKNARQSDSFEICREMLLRTEGMPAYPRRRSPEGSDQFSESDRLRCSFSSLSLPSEQEVDSENTNVKTLASDETGVKTTVSSRDICSSNSTFDDKIRRLNVVCEKGDHGLGTSPNICDMCKQFRLSLMQSKKQHAPSNCGNMKNGKTGQERVVRRKNTNSDFKSDRQSWPPRSLDIQPPMLVDSKKSSSDKSSLSSTREIYLRRPDQQSVFETNSGSINSSRIFQNNLDIDEHDVENGDEHIRNDRQTPRLNIQQSDTSNNITSHGTTPPSGPLSATIGEAIWTKRKKVFVTYSWNANEDDVRFLEEVSRLCGAIDRAGARIRIDTDAESFEPRRVNRLDWLDHQYTTADWILVCISPTYSADIKPDINAANPRENQLNARSIFDKIRLEYHNNNSRNRRSIPVLFSNFGATHTHVPHCLSTTTSWQYPLHENDIVQEIINGTIPFRDE